MTLSIRMADIARAAGVSITTVSHVVNGTRSVAPATRARVHESMRLLGYARDVGARPARAATRAIGLAMTATASDAYWVDLIRGASAAAEAAGLGLVVVDTRDDPRHEASAVATLLDRGVDGLIVAPAHGWRDLPCPVLRDVPVPFVVVDRFCELPVDQVGVENEASAAAVVDHLLAIGHTRIAMIAGLRGLSTSEERVRGYELAHKIRQVPTDVALLACGESSYEGGRKAMLDLLEMNPPPTAVFAANNNMVIGAIAALRAAGVHVPQEMAVVGFDDFPWADYFDPGLTTVAQPAGTIGARAAQLLLRRLDDDAAPWQVNRYPAEIMHRSSCGCGLPRALAPLAV
ncbi:transcriptional regulator, LacI family [Actinokineospora alba]|uniref:Transcriptional regulator, LacI family n=1 Tax=Actinokineospora alba TaxID=504798 RepID=A0A1H0QRL0_9PSEU|nr:LacI family DNA-binding transcriptional regulator [Actinokineospora alba]TDP70427.1 LacI family transcriptional regulator [Actinokineospora alba]SDI31838.1 LacI family transcriptional regulator [Actinokineospora alba]SDP19902.1 transcriptional regulator, LacI family [Actinokineospora alba]